MTDKMTAAEYMTRATFNWDGGRWQAVSRSMTPEAMARLLETGRYGPMFRETAKELAEGGTFDVHAIGARKTYTVVHADGCSRLYQRAGDAVRRDFPGSQAGQDEQEN